MRILEVDPFWKLYLVEHNGFKFQAMAVEEDEYSYVTPIDGWDEVAACTNQHPEWLAEELECCLYEFNKNNE